MKPLLCLLFAPLFSVGQDNSDTLSFNYTGVELVDSTSAKTLLSRAKLYIAESFKSAKDVIQLDDQDANVVVAKGNVEPIIKIPLLGKSAYGFVHFTMKIQTKDGKYKYTISEFDHESHARNEGSGGALTNAKPACGTFLMSKSYWRQIKEYTNKDIIAFIDGLRAKMKSGELSKQDNF